MDLCLEVEEGGGETSIDGMIDNNTENTYYENW